MKISDEISIFPKKRYGLSMKLSKILRPGPDRVPGRDENLKPYFNVAQIFLFKNAFKYVGLKNKIA